MMVISSLMLSSILFNPMDDGLDVETNGMGLEEEEQRAERRNGPPKRGRARIRNRCRKRDGTMKMIGILLLFCSTQLSFADRPAEAPQPEGLVHRGITDIGSRGSQSSGSSNSSSFSSSSAFSSSWPGGRGRGWRPGRQIRLAGNDSSVNGLGIVPRNAVMLGSGEDLDSSLQPEHFQRQRFGEDCECWNSSDGNNREVECSCTKLVANMTLAKDVHRITVEHSETFTTLSNEHIRPFASSLLELILSELPHFSRIEDGAFIGMKNLHTIYIDGAPALTNISQKVFKGFFPKLKTIKIVHTGLEVTPMLNQLATTNHLDSLDFENNNIRWMEPKWVDGLKVEHLTLSYNNLESIRTSAFEGATIARLTLKGNVRLRDLHPQAFGGIESLRQLDLSKTAITYLPTYGLKHLEVLRLQQTPSLTVIPSIYHFESLQEAAMTYPYHCCAFANPETHDPVEYKRFQEFVEKVNKTKCEKSSEEMSSSPVSVISSKRRRKRQQQSFFPTTPRPGTDETSGRTPWVLPGVTSFDFNAGHMGGGFNFGANIQDDGFNDHPYVFDPDLPYPLDELDESLWDSGKSSSISEEFGTFHHSSVTVAPQVIPLCGNVAVRKTPVVKCTPEPDAFSPCEDIMGNMWLRTAVWFVVTLALVGNMAVLVVLILTPGRMSVQRFLMANLSFADLCMGIYLLMVAVQDLVSLGVYFNFAIDWQLGWGCQLAGFMTVFASELSVFTLAVITGERWYALTRAIHLTKRLTIKGASKLMALGWLLAINCALLPLVGISSYSKTSICLPMEAGSSLAQVYLAFMLLFNGLAFSMVAYAYWQMYRTVAGHSGAGAPATQSADLAIAKKMGLLVFTDFVCWAPVAFFGLTAVAGHPLIGVTDAKILLVFFYPLNSFCNPYLYAILTKQYRRDLFLLLHRHGLCSNTLARFRSNHASTNNTVPTMQTMMRIGSVTETPRHNSGRISVSSASADPHHQHNHQNNVLNSLKSNGNGMAPHTQPPTPPSSAKNSVGTTVAGMNSSVGDVGKNNYQRQHSAIHFDLPDDDDDEVEKSVDERINAETSFISMPSSASSNEKQAEENKGKVSKSFIRARIDPHNRVSTLPTIKDSSTDDPEVSEMTPFCPAQDR